MELTKIGEKTYYLKNATNIGIYQIDDHHVFLIDTGNDKDTGKKVLKIVEEQGWEISGIINTHSHADHIGGNQVIQERTNCPIYSYQSERAFTEYPILEPSFLYGGFPLEELKNKFLLAKPSHTTAIEDNLPNGLEFIVLRGHSCDHIGIKTSDDVYFLGDAVISLETIQKYHLFYLCDVKELLNSLDIVEQLDGKMFIASHNEAVENIQGLVQANRAQVQDILHTILTICQTNQTFENILQKIFEHYDMHMNLNQYFLISCTLRSYLTYLCNEKQLSYYFEHNQMFYQSN